MVVELAEPSGEAVGAAAGEAAVTAPSEPSGEALGEPLGSAVDAVAAVDHIVHDESAAEPHTNDAIIDLPAMHFERSEESCGVLEQRLLVGPPLRGLNSWPRVDLDTVLQLRLTN